MDENYKLAKWLSGEMTENELTAFQAEPDFAIYNSIKKYSAELATPNFDEDKSLATILASPKKEIKTISLVQNWYLRIAAVLVIGLGLFFTFKNFTTSTEFATNGQQSTFILPDNSEVVLNSGSEIQYKKWKWDNNRSLNLTGEAYFKVAKGKTFEVNTAHGKVTVLGTQFNVKQRENRIDVSCYEGKVKVNYRDKEIIITRGMSIAYENGEEIKIPFNSLQSPEWMNNELVFNQVHLKSILSELERHFNITLELKTKNDSQLFTGTIPVENIDVALQILSNTFHLKTIKESKEKIILKAVDVQK
jgi:transmembrane sensor